LPTNRQNSTGGQCHPANRRFQNSDSIGCTNFAIDLVDQADIFLKINFSWWANPADEFFVEAVADPFEDSLHLDEMPLDGRRVM
jgi:hypothetical protein